MARIYANLIRKGLKTIDDVPVHLREAVQKILGHRAQGIGHRNQYYSLFTTKDVVNLEEFILKGFELGALGIISLFLLTKGMTAIKDLSDSNKLLADAVTKLSDKVNMMDGRFLSIEFELRRMNSRLDKIEDYFERKISNENIH